MPRPRLAPAALALLLLAAARVAPLPAQEGAHVHPSGGAGAHLGKVGTVTFPNSGAAAAQAPFLRGLALLHSFEYEDAADAFRAAQAADPGFAMAYWGEALAQKAPIWQQEDLATARAALARLAPTREARAAKAPTARERAYLEAVETLFGEGEEPARARAYEAAMARLSAEYRDDDEAAALHALSLIANHAFLTAPADRHAGWLRAAAILEGVFRRRPDHPGAAHYLIHAYDDPALAERGLPAARAYAAIAPAAGHALHMPSHIFVQRGVWDEVALSNAAAVAASIAWVARRGLSAGYRDWHSYEWLHYAALQQGKTASAGEMADSARALIDPLPDSLAGPGRRALALMRIQAAAETGRWPSLEGEEMPRTGLGVYLHGMAAASRGDRAVLAEAARRAGVVRDGIPDAFRRRLWEVAARHLEAEGLRLAGREGEALARLEEAAVLEDSIPASGPPPLVPTREMIAALHLAAGHAGQAAAEYDRALARMPNRSAALLGRARAAARLGRGEEARGFYARLLANWHAADASLPALAEARRGAAGGRTASAP